MARSGQVTVAAGTVTQLTNADVTGMISLFNRGAYAITILGTTDTTPPAEADFVDGYVIPPGQGAVGYTLAELFPGASFVRLWAWPGGVAGQVAVYHG